MSMKHIPHNLQLYLKKFFSPKSKHILSSNILLQLKRKAETNPQSSRIFFHSAKKKQKTKERTYSQQSERPNFFVAVQVEDKEIAENALIIQKSIQSKSNKDYSDAFIGVEKFHITLMVMCLKDESEIKRACACLQDCQTSLTTIASGSICLDFDGLDVFGKGRVLFSPPSETDGLLRLRKIKDFVQEQMENSKIYSADLKKEWNPHLTLMKFTGSKSLLRQGLRCVKPSHYKAESSTTLGSQVVKSLQLCQMNKKQEDGYYFVHQEVLFADPP